MWAAISNHTQDHALLRVSTHSVGCQTVSECRKNEKPFVKESMDHLWEDFCFPLKILQLYPSVQRYLLSLQATGGSVDGVKDTLLGKGRLTRDLVVIFRYLKG